jgi:hypothetical protein
MGNARTDPAAARTVELAPPAKAEYCGVEERDDLSSKGPKSLDYGELKSSLLAGTVQKSSDALQRQIAAK